MGTKIAGKLLFIGEFCLSLTAVGLFWSTSSGHFREKLWEYGGVKGWNSNPNHRVYSYANYEEPPEIPLIWSPSERLIATALEAIKAYRTTPGSGYQPVSVDLNLMDGEDWASQEDN
ncbi:hypothetical protein CSPAE12_06028 [Colletotrichum incanum]|nr:hypothetical protein CSPAE12_06028 [Colletotrichum incanum]